MIDITFPDGQIRQYENGTTPMAIAKSISEGLAKKILVSKINDQIWDLQRPLNQSATIRFHSWDEKEGKATYWHSSAHLMAEALEALYPGVKFGIGPAIDHGFYYDVDLAGYTLQNEDLVKIEKKMAELAASNNEYKRSEISKDDALNYFIEKGDQYKIELINELNDGEITFYRQGNFIDLCRGPHIPNTGYIKAIKLTSIAGAYWRGDQTRQQLTRIYGITFPKQKDLDEYLQMLEEAKKRDHRRLGKELEIFTFDDDVGPGMPLWLPNGGALIEQLEKLAKKTEFDAGYHRVRSPHIAKESMYLKSGHLPYYQDSMFPPIEIDGQKFYLKAMNCPHHHKIFDAIPRSYKDLPLRLAEYGMCYRYEQSGELFGLMRVRSLQMNDAHIYCTREQFGEEFRAVNEMYLKYFKIFGVDKYVMRFSTHDPAKLGQKYIDDAALWIETEKMVRNVLIESNIPYVEVPDEAAFYGPKIDVQIWSAIGREFTLATNQVDFAQAKRFDLQYTTPENETAQPLIIHRAPLGTHERFIGFLIEHYAGNFPVWLAPVQAILLPISDKHITYAKNLLQEFKKSDIRCTIDDRSEKIGKKIRDAELKKIPYMLIIGDKEVEARALSVRKKGSGDLGSIHTSEVIASIKSETDAIFN